MDWVGLIVTAALLLIGYLIGTKLQEGRHLASLLRREEHLKDMVVTNVKAVARPETVSEAFLVIGEVVIATDYFKSFAAGLKNILGGEIRTYRTLLDRARREATLRMLERARRRGATEVWNVRYGTSNVLSARGNRAGTSVEVFAVGTAVIRRR